MVKNIVADTLMLAEGIGVNVPCKQLDLSTKTVYNWQHEVCLKSNQEYGAQSDQTVDLSLNRYLLPPPLPGYCE